MLQSQRDYTARRRLAKKLAMRRIAEICCVMTRRTRNQVRTRSNGQSFQRFERSLSSSFSRENRRHGRLEIHGDDRNKFCAVEETFNSPR